MNPPEIQQRKKYAQATALPVPSSSIRALPEERSPVAIRLIIGRPVRTAAEDCLHLWNAELLLLEIGNQMDVSKAKLLIESLALTEVGDIKYQLPAHGKRLGNYQRLSPRPPNAKSDTILQPAGGIFILS